MQIRSTTVIGVVKDGKCAIGGDGQVTIGQSIMKHNSKKVRKLYNDTVLAGFAGASADAFTLFERFEDKLQQYHGNLSRASVELAKEWRLDKYLRRPRGASCSHEPRYDSRYFPETAMSLNRTTR